MKMQAWLIELGLGLLLLVGLWFGVQWWESTVYARGYSAAVADRVALDAKQVAAAAADASRKERVMQDQLEAENLKRLKGNLEYEKTIASLTGRIADGTVRLRAQGTCIRSNAAPADPGPASGPVDQAGFELLPGTSGSVLDAARRLAEGVRDRNALIDRYNTMRAACNAP
jgi:hypothetical protein